MNDFYIKRFKEGEAIPSGARFIKIVDDHEYVKCLVGMTLEPVRLYMYEVPINSVDES